MSESYTFSTVRKKQEEAGRHNSECPDEDTKENRVSATENTIINGIIKLLKYLNVFENQVGR